MAKTKAARAAIEAHHWRTMNAQERERQLALLRLRAKSPMRAKVEQDGIADLPMFQTDLEEFTS